MKIVMVVVLTGFAIMGGVDALAWLRVDNAVVARECVRAGLDVVPASPLDSISPYPRCLPPDPAKAAVEPT